MHMKYYRKMNEFNPDAGGSAGSEVSTQGQADGATNTNQESGAQGGQESGTQDQDNTHKFSVDSLPQEAQDLIKNLRAENAEHRTKNNNLSTRMESIEKGFKTMFGDEGGEQALTPEEQLQQLQGGYEDLSYNNAIMGMAYENGIPMENYEYFNFLMDKEVNGLEEGQELSEESLLSVIQKAKGFNQPQSDTNSSVDSNGDQRNDPNGGQELTIEAFSKMSVVEKSELYRKKPAVYNSLMKEAKNKRLL